MLLAVLTKYDGAFLGPIAVVLGWFLNGIYSFFSNFGIQNAGFCIIIFTFVVNALMIPMTIKQQKFSKLSSKMSPELTKIQEKYKGKKDETSLRNSQAETQAVYEKYGANPTGGCLPMLITMPILFALYRVIYNIPAYVSGIKDFYSNVASALLGTDYLATMTEYANSFTILNVKKWGDISTSISSDHIIDILSQFNATHWNELMSNPNFASIHDIIQTNSQQIIKINTFGFGLNIAETPMGQFMASGVPVIIKLAYILIPVLSIITQIIQTKLMTRNVPQSTGNDTAASTMKTMNTIMPYFSGAICLTLPVGLGIYWIAGSVFRIFQQLILDKHMEKVDIDALIEKNKEKQKKRKAKIGANPSMSMEEYAKKKTSTIGERASVNSKKIDGLASENKAEDSNTEYKSGSIADYANMLNRSQKEKEGK